MMTDTDYMKLALAAAQQAFDADEVPVGAVLVDEGGTVMATAYNTAEHGLHAMEHAEIKVLREGAEKMAQTRLWGCTLYVTLEPCPMCAAALSMMRIKRLVYGAENPKGGAVHNGIKFFEAETSHFTPEITKGVLAEECGKLLTEFFKQKRK